MWPLGVGLKAFGKIMSRKVIDEVDHRYDRLVVLERRGSDKWKQAKWLCECSCGNLVVVRGKDLRSGHTKSCGCFRRERMSLPEGEGAFNELLRRMQYGAKRRGYQWQLTKEQIYNLTKQSCYYCGMKPSQISNPLDCHGIFTYNGLDRVDNEHGYTIDNVVPCCETCNRAKRTQTTEQFKAWVRNIYEHFARI